MYTIKKFSLWPSCTSLGEQDVSEDMGVQVGRTWVWERRVRGDGGHGHACGQDAGEDVGVGEEVEGRWTHCDLHVSCHTYLLILEE